MTITGPMSDLRERFGDIDIYLFDPLKTTIVQNQRCMTTWVVRKGV